jgi:four helix bundle protein
MSGEYGFKSLDVWVLSRDLAVDIYRITNKGAFIHDFSFKDQIRRAAVSIASNIAEGNARNSVKDAIRIINIAQGSLAELITQIEIAKKIEYINESESGALEERMTDIGKMLNGLIKAKNRYLNPKEQ